MVGKLPFTALTDGVTGEARESPPHLVSVITGFHRRKEGMKRPNTAECRDREGLLRAGQEKPATEDAAPPRPAPLQLCTLISLLGACPFPFLSVFPPLGTLCPSFHSSVRRAIRMKSKLLRHPQLCDKRPVFCSRGALSDVMSENLPEHSRIYFRDNAEGTQTKQNKTGHDVHCSLSQAFSLPLVIFEVV